MPILDPALFRRFDAAFRYELPAKADVAPLIKNRLSIFGLGRMGWKRVAESARGLSHAEIVQASESAARLAVLDHRKSIRTDDLVNALRDRHASQSE